MNFTYAKLTTLRPQKEKCLLTFVTAFFVAAAFFVPYIIAGHGYFTFYGDFNVQQISFYKTCHEAIRTGNIKWSWLTDLGANFVGSYTFYLLGSPFFWLTIPFPTNFVPYLMGPLLILKFACAATTGYLYIRRFTKTADAAYLGGLLYAFSGFSIYNIFFNHFHEAIIIFPLLLLSLELLMVENRRGFFAITVCACAVINYYFFFGMVVFTALYFFVRVGSGAVKVKFSRFLVIAFEAVLGVMLAAVLLIPSFMAVRGNSRLSDILLGWNAIMYGKEQIYLNIIECFFFPPDLPARPVFFPSANVKWSSLGGWLPVFSMTGVFLWFMNRPKTWIKRLLGISIFAALVPILNSAFSALNSAYYARWFYMPILIMCLATAMMTEDSRVDWWPGFRWSAGVTAGFILAIGLFPQKNSNGNIVFGLFSDAANAEKYQTVTLFGKFKFSFSIVYFLRFWITAGIAVAGLVLLFFLIRLKAKDMKRFYRAAVACVCAVTVVYANFFVYSGRSHSHAIKEVLIDQLIEGNVDLDGSSDDYRIDVFDGVDNTGMFLKYPCINAFHSVVPASITEFYDYIGIERSVASRPDENYPSLRSFLSVKYILNSTYSNEKFMDDDGRMKLDGYRYVKTDGGYDVYENLNYIPYGFSYDYYMDYDYCEQYNNDYRVGTMLKAVLLDDEQISKYSDILKDISEVDAASEDSDISLEHGSGGIAKDSRRLKATAAYEFTTDNNGFTARVRRDKRSLVFFSVPYDEGWSATVDGKPVEIEKVNVGFMAVAVDAGDSEIRFDYKTQGLSSGLIISAGAVILLAAYLLISHGFKKKHPSQTEYPEGVKLLDEWRKEDIAESVKEGFNDKEDGDYIPDDFDRAPDDSEFKSRGGFEINPWISDDDNDNT